MLKRFADEKKKVLSGKLPFVIQFFKFFYPLAAILGFVFAGFSYISGNPNARSHLVLAIIGAVVGFGASSIVNFIRSLIH